MQHFVGQFECTLDSKGRLMIPAKFRRVIPSESGEILVISKGKEKCLNLYPTEGWNEVIQQLRSLPPGPERRNLIRFYSDKSQTLNLDKAGRVAIPAGFLGMIGGPRKVVVIGALTYMEIWSPEDYEEIRTRAMETYLEGDWEY